MSGDPPPSDAQRRRDFVRQHTVLLPVPLLREIRVHTASELVPLWSATHTFSSYATTDVVPDVPYWCVPWAGGQALARWVLDHRETVAGKRVLDFGAGSGLLAIAAAKAGASVVRAVDVDPFAAAACALNAEANDVDIEIVCEDIVDHDVAGDHDVILAGDVWYQLTPSARFAGWFRSLVQRGRRVLTGDPGRAYVPSTAAELAVYEVPTSLDLESQTIRTTRVLEIRA